MISKFEVGKQMEFEKDFIHKLAERLEIVLRSSDSEIGIEELTPEVDYDRKYTSLLYGQLKQFHDFTTARKIARISIIKYILNSTFQSLPAPETSNIESLPHSPQSSSSGTP